jgi:hypothetical protein
MPKNGPNTYANIDIFRPFTAILLLLEKGVEAVSNVLL